MHLKEDNFKKEILIFSEKFYNESSEDISRRINTLTKKIQNTENNIMNKYKIMKE